MTTTTTTCPGWCITDHAAESQAWRDRDAANGIPPFSDPSEYETDCVGVEAIGEIPGQTTIGARLTYNLHDGVRVWVFERTDDGDRDIEGLTPTQAQLLGRILAALAGTVSP